MSFKNSKQMKAEGKRMDKQARAQKPETIKRNDYWRHRVSNVRVRVHQVDNTMVVYRVLTVSGLLSARFNKMQIETFKSRYVPDWPERLEPHSPEIYNQLLALLELVPRAKLPAILRAVLYECQSQMAYDKDMEILREVFDSITKYRLERAAFNKGCTCKGTFHKEGCPLYKGT